MHPTLALLLLLAPSRLDQSQPISFLPLLAAACCLLLPGVLIQRQHRWRASGRVVEARSVPKSTTLPTRGDDSTLLIFVMHVTSHVTQITSSNSEVQAKIRRTCQCGNTIHCTNMLCSYVHPLSLGLTSQHQFVRL